MRYVAAIVACLLLVSSPGVAQQPPPPPSGSQSSPLVATLTVTTASARVALPAPVVGYPWALLFNDGASETFVAVGDNTVSAAPTNYAIPPGGNYAVYLLQGTTSVAAITAAGGSILRISQWNGWPWAGGSPGGGAAPQPVATSPVSFVPTAGVFSSAIAASATRKSCLVQNVGTTLGYVYFGLNVNAAFSNSFQIAPYGAVSCADSAAVEQGNVSATCASGTCAFVVKSE